MGPLKWGLMWIFLDCGGGCCCWWWWCCCICWSCCRCWSWELSDEVAVDGRSARCWICLGAGDLNSPFRDKQTQFILSLTTRALAQKHQGPHYLKNMLTPQMETPHTWRCGMSSMNSERQMQIAQSHNKVLQGFSGCVTESGNLI